MVHVRLRRLRTRRHFHPLQRIHWNTVDIQRPMQMRRSGAARGTSEPDHVTLLNSRALDSRDLRHMQIHRFETLPMIDGNSAAVQIKLARDFHHPRCRRVDRRARRGSQIQTAVKIAGWFAVMQTLHSE